ncbi:MAG: hypothetical protein WB816_03375 [Methylocystis sp.]
MFDQAPPLNLDPGSEPLSEPLKVSQVEKAGDVANAGDVETAGAIEKGAKVEPRPKESTGKCLVKVDGRVLIDRSCLVSWTKQQRASFPVAGKPLTVSLDHGRTWRATLGSQELGKVFKTGSCWGSERVYACEHYKK